VPEPAVLDLGGTWRLGWQDTRRGDRAYAESAVDDQQDWLDAVVPGEACILTWSGRASSSDRARPRCPDRPVGRPRHLALRRDVELDAVPPSVHWSSSG
jgi:hypothetical protein